MKSLFCFALLSVFCLTGCVTASCPGYDLNDFSTISYRRGDKLTYVSNKSDTLVLRVSDFYSRGGYEFSSYPDYECDLDTYYQTEVNNGISIKEHIIYDMHITIGDDDEYNVILSDYSVPGNYNVEMSDTLYNGHHCKKYLITDLTLKRRFSEVVKMDFRGIIEFYDKETELTWRLAE